MKAIELKFKAAPMNILILIMDEVTVCIIKEVTCHDERTELSPNSSPLWSVLASFSSLF